MSKKRLSSSDIEILMALQYDFPLISTPFDDLAHKLGLRPDELISRVSYMKSLGIIKRVGFYMNFRAVGLKGALVAFNSQGKVDKLAAILNDDPLVSHNFQRDHPVYDVWAVVKARSKSGIIEKVEKTAMKLGISDYVVLFSRKTLKLSVKYDLYTGLSRSGRWSLISQSPPMPEELGIPSSLPRDLRVLPITRNPYAPIASKYGMNEDEVVLLARELLKKGVLGDPGAALDGRAVGFRVNGMTVVAGDNLDYVCSRIAERVSEATHVVLREPYPSYAWRHNCYFMIHATSKDLLEKRVKTRMSELGIEDYLIIYSIRDLKPDVVR